MPLPARPRRNPVLVKSLLVVAAWSLALLWSWWSDPSVLAEATAEQVLTPVTPLETTPVYLGLAHPALHGTDTVDLTFGRVRVRVGTNTAKATVEVDVCLARAGSPPVDVVDAGSIGRHCAVLTPLVPGSRLAWTDGDLRQYLVLKVTPTRTGVTEVTGVDLTYTTGWKDLRRHGTDHRALDITVVVGAG